MRDIKFRIWDCMDNKFREVIGFDYNCGGIKRNAVQVWNEDFEVIEHYEDSEIQQYTGLKDKNNKEIYEGDIVKTTGMIESIGKVVFKDCEFCIEVKEWYSSRPHCQSLRLKEKYNDGKSSFDFDKHFEVIGNIYENKDLLDKER